MQKHAVCPCCGSVVTRDTMPLSGQIAEIMDYTDMTRLPAYLFLILWSAKGRTVTFELILDLLDRHWGEGHEYDHIRDAIRHVRRQVEAQSIPVDVQSMRGIGYRLVRKDRDWHWTDRKTFQPVDEFDFS